MVHSDAQNRFIRIQFEQTDLRQTANFVLRAMQLLTLNAKKQNIPVAPTRHMTLVSKNVLPARLIARKGNRKPAGYGLIPVFLATVYARPNQVGTGTMGSGHHSLATVIKMDGSGPRPCST